MVAVSKKVIVMQGLVNKCAVRKDIITNMPLTPRKSVAILNNCLSVDTVAADRDGTLVTDLSYKELTRDFIDRARPDLVIAPLFTSHFDVIDIIERLLKIGFAGKLCAVTARVPDGKSVEAEISRHCPDFDFRLIELD